MNKVEREYAYHLLIKLAARKAQDGDGDLAQYVRDAADVWNKVARMDDGEVVPSHICRHCGALWRFWPACDTQDQESEGWQLRSKVAGSCCNNALTMRAVVPLTWRDMLADAPEVPR